MKAGAFSADMLDLLRLLDGHGVRYLLIGGYAVAFHGYVRFTGDIDLAYDPDVENGERLFSALREFWGGPVPHVTCAADLMQPGMVFQFGVAPNRVDLLSRVSGLDFDAAWSRRIMEPVEGLNLMLSIVALEDLRSTKRAAGRWKDLDDLAHLPEP